MAVQHSRPTFGQRVVRVVLLSALIGGGGGLFLGAVVGYQAGVHTHPFSIPTETMRRSRSIPDAQHTVGVETAIEMAVVLAVVGTLGVGLAGGLIYFGFGQRDEKSDSPY